MLLSRPCLVSRTVRVCVGFPAPSHDQCCWTHVDPAPLDLTELAKLTKSTCHQAAQAFISMPCLWQRGRMTLPMPAPDHRCRTRRTLPDRAQAARPAGASYCSHHGTPVASGNSKSHMIANAQAMRQQPRAFAKLRANAQFTMRHERSWPPKPHEYQPSYDVQFIQSEKNRLLP